MVRGMSLGAGREEITLKYILENVQKTDKILDVGFGSGIYGKLLKENGYQNIDGVDIYGDEIDDELRNTYTNIYIEDICKLNFNHYNLIIMGDVLEHIDLEPSKELIKKIEPKCDHLLVILPYQMPQHGSEWNPHDEHKQADITEEYMTEHFPNLTRLFVGTTGTITQAIYKLDKK